MKRSATIKDIAKELNISTSTVSRALTDRWDVNVETRRQVLEVAKKLNYIPNPMAIRLLRKRSKIIGLVVPEFQNSFFPTIIIAIQKVLEKEGYQLLITQSNESSEDEEKNLHLLQNSMVEGILISVTKERENVSLYKEIIESGIPIVFFNRVCTEIDTSKVIIDDVKMAFFAVEHLIYSGRKRIAHFEGPKTLELSEKRKKGYIDALSKHKFPVDPSLIVPSGVMMEKGYEAMKNLIRQNNIPDAIFAFCDPVAIGVMKALKENGIRIPEDVAIVGFSESRSALLVEPNLTTVAQPLQEIGETAARLLIDEINNNINEQPVVHETVKLSACLNIRESSVSRKK